MYKRQTLPYTLRILLGANGETGMKDVDYYLEHYPQPAFFFTPDAEFPVCYGEKGGYGGWLVSAPLHGSLIDFQAIFSCISSSEHSATPFFALGIL